MRKKWMILAGCFFGGILLCGLGTGIGFVEFSHFTYAGDRELGTIKEETLTYVAEDDVDTYYVRVPFGRNHGKTVNMVSDNSLPEGAIEIDVQYNDDYEMPYLYGEEWYSPYYEEYESYEYDEYLVEGTDEETVVEEEEIKREGCLNVYLDSDPVKIMMRYKDIILEDIKNGQIGSYSSDESWSFRIEEIRYHPSLEGKIKLLR